MAPFKILQISLCYKDICIIQFYAPFVKRGLVDLLVTGRYHPAMPIFYRFFSCWWLICCGLGVVACHQPSLMVTPTPSSTPLPVAMRTATPWPGDDSGPLLATVAVTMPIVTAVADIDEVAAGITPLPFTATPDPYAGLTIAALRARSYGGGELQIVETLAESERWLRYLFTYPSDGLTIYGYLTVPREGAEFPVVIMLHGYIPPAEYETVTYTRRYAEALAEAGYMVIHPNLRNYPPSDEGADPFRVGMAVDVLNLIAVIWQQSQDPTGYLRRADAENLHLWGHSMGGGVALRVLVVCNAALPEVYLRTAVLYGSMSGDEGQNYAQIQQWSGGERGGFELAAGEERLTAVSPITYLADITAAISIHHSDADPLVPLAWAEDLCARLQAWGKPVECFTYHAAPHTFNGANDTLFMERVRWFYDRYAGD